MTSKAPSRAAISDSLRRTKTASPRRESEEGRSVDLHSSRTTIGHAVNSRARLRWFLRRGLELAEGDICMGRHAGDSRRTAIMAHPPEKTSDLSFSQWVDAALDNGHAIKADIKERRVIPLVTKTLKSRNFPESRLILNADVFKGAQGRSTRLSLKDLLALRRKFPRAMISIGCAFAVRGAPVLDRREVRRFKEFARKVGKPATVCLRADIALRSPATAAQLFAGNHVTIWNCLAFPAGPSTARHFRRLVKKGLVDLMDKRGEAIV